jgi:hypothetical protein
MLKLTTFETTSDYHAADSYAQHVPQFQGFWGQCQYGRSLKRLNVTNQSMDQLNGQYLIYWTDTTDLPENQHLKQLVLASDSLMRQGRKFWHGDVFIIALGKDERGYDFDKHGWTIYRDVDEAFLQPHVMKTVFKDFWNTEMLEQHSREDVKLREFEDNTRAKALILASM